MRLRRWSVLVFLLVQAGATPAFGGSRGGARADIHAGIDARGRLVVAAAPGPGLTRFDPRRSPDPRRDVREARAMRALQGRCALRWGGLINEAIANTVVVPELVLAVMESESACDPRARSPSGAIGLMQVMPATGLRFGADDLFDPSENVRAAVRYLAWLHQRFDGDTRLMLAAYNAGEGAVQRHHGHIPPFVETRAYVTAVMRRYSALQTHAWRQK